MLYLLSFLLLFTAVITALLIAVDVLYARTGADRRLDRANGHHWSPEQDVLVEEPVVGRTLLPAAVRPRLWLAVAASFILGCAALVLAA